MAKRTKKFNFLNPQTEGHVPVEHKVNQIKDRMAVILKRQKKIISLMDAKKSEKLVSEFKDLGEEYAHLSKEFMKPYFKK